MKHFFNLDAPVVQAATRFGNLMLLNIWWLICCVPVVTIGAACSAMHSMMYRLREEEACRTKDFFAAFLRHFGKSTAMWLLLVVSAAALAGLYVCLLNVEVVTVLKIILLAIFCSCFFAWAIVLIYVFPLIACYEFSIGKTTLTALFLGLKDLRITIIAFALTIIPLIAGCLSLYWFLYFGFFWIFIYPGLAFYWKSSGFMKTFSTTPFIRRDEHPI